MISEEAAVTLRPMSVGEMIDRAFTVYLKNAIVLTAALIVVLGPMLALSYLSERGILGFDMSMFAAAMKNPGSPPPPPDMNQMASAYMSALPLMGLTLLLTIFALPFANSAIIAGISRSYLGQPVRFADCYRDAFARWGQILILAVLWIVALIGAYIAFVIFMFVIVIVMGAAIATKLPSALGVVAALFAIPAFIWLLFSACQVYLAWALSFAAVTIERTDPVSAFGSSFSRVFGGGAYWRSFGLSAAVFGIAIGLELIAGGLFAAIFFLLKLSVESAPIVLYGWSGLVGAVSTPLLFAVVAMYYYDARIRREGFDLEHLARQLSGGEPALPTTPA
jgi:hypothetical protein